MSAWTNAYWPRSGDRGSTSTVQELAPDERVAAAARGLAVRPRRSPRRARRAVNDWPSTAASWSSVRSAGVERVEPGGDERVERLRDGELAEVAGRLEAAVVASSEPAVGDEHPDRLDRVQRDALGARDDRRGPPARAGRARGRRAARASRPRRAAARSRARKSRLPAPQPGPALEQLGPGQRDDQDRDVAAPLEQVVDEVEQSPESAQWRSSNSERDRRRGRRAARRTCATPRTAPSRPPARRLAEPEQREEARLDPAPLRRRRARARASDLGDLRARRSASSSLSSRPARRADHLAQRPEGDPLAVRRASGPRASRPARRRRRRT